MVMLLAYFLLFKLVFIFYELLFLYLILLLKYVNHFHDSKVKLYNKVHLSLSPPIS